ncbi:MAG: hypothetical protein R3C16_12385 [Hyphomonadaceae bacterium]
MTHVVIAGGVCAGGAVRADHTILALVADAEHAGAGARFTRICRW